MLKGLTKLGVRAGRHRAHRLGARYRDQFAAMKQVAKVCRLKSLAHADHFFEGLGKGHFDLARWFEFATTSEPTIPGTRATSW